MPHLRFPIPAARAVGCASLAALASCFVASDTAGLPCDNADACDPEQSCHAGVCMLASADNLLTNPSFEDWADGIPIAWVAHHAELTQSTDAPVHGDLALRMRGQDFNSVTQTLVQETSWPAGTRFEGRVWTRYVDGAMEPPLFELHLVYASDGIYAYGTTPQLAGSQWLELVATAEATDTVVAVEVQIFGSGAAEQTVEFDDASVVVVD